MKLLSTLNHALNHAVQGSGNYGGDLRLFFTTLNPADWKATPPPILWESGGGAVDTYKLPTGDSIALNLNLITEPPGYVYIFGTIAVTTGSVTYGGGPPIGQATSTFVPGKPVLTALQGRSQGSQGGLQFDVGFQVTVPWDGISADCRGVWWATWH